MALAKTSTTSVPSRRPRPLGKTPVGKSSAPIGRAGDLVSPVKSGKAAAQSKSLEQSAENSVGYAFRDANIQRAIDTVRDGASYEFLPALARKLNLPSEQLIAALALPRSTVKRNQSLGKALSHESTDRMYRATRVYDCAVRIFEDQPAAVRWLQRSRAAFNGASALSLVDTTPGYELVLAELGRIEAGVVA